MAVRRKAKGDEGVAVHGEAEVERLLGEADHVVNLLPGGEATKGFMSAGRIGAMKRSAVLYNIGRGTTVDQQALAEALGAGRIAGAYLDVMEPEPLPAGHRLWTLPNCYITPHTAGGQRREFVRLVEHFVGNLRLYEEGKEVRDRVI
jgi:phosphoglycerate dehydrogenase-like enzyme